tara:strand:- start:245 stop:760 length:516 start_codon:yes stop_codon:yes gene_type:complete
MTTKQKHNHGASRSGKKSEDRVTIVTAKSGFQHLRLKKDFENSIHKYDGTVRLEKPEKYTLAKKKRTNHFFSDGLINNPKNNKGAILESKNSNAHGTTEEKVFYDLHKIKDGVYGDKYPLVYLFQGSVCEDVNEYRLFADEIKRLKLPVHVVFDSTSDLRIFSTFMEKLLS